MTLADRLQQKLQETGSDFSGALSEAARFVFDEKASAMAAGAVIRPDEVARAIPMPAAMSWVELLLADEAVGMLAATSPDNLRRGRAVVARLPRGAHVLSLTTAMLDLDDGGIVGVAEPVARALIGALAMLATPALCDKREVSRDKLNRARAKSGKPALLNRSVVTIDLARPQSGSSTRGDGHSRRHHFVRAFLRFRRGGMELVRPHWRGDATLGVSKPNFRVTA